jgi:hypothetical protein
VFAIILSLFAYFASALWSAIFIVSLPMDKDAIVDAVEIGETEDRYGGTKTKYHLEFKNCLAKLKYDHNVRMRDRNRYWLYSELILGGLIGLFVFYIVPKWRQTLDIKQDPTELVVGGIIMGVLVVLIIPMVLSWVLPAPAKWFPKEIRNIAEIRQQEALSRLKKDAESLEDEGVNGGIYEYP